MDSLYSDMRNAQAAGTSQTQLQGTSVVRYHEVGNGVVAQIWRRGSGRQAEVSRLLGGVDVRALDEDLGKKAGVLLGRSGTADAVDAALVCLAADGDDILTSDPEDLRTLAEAAGVHVDPN